MDGRAQLFGGEFLASYMVFLTALVMFLYLWNSNLLEINTAEKQQDMNNLAVDATEQLLRTPGSPSNWTVQNVTVLGLANQSRVLMPEKIESFLFLMDTKNSSMCVTTTNYECNRYLLGLGRYDFTLNMTYLNETPVRINSTLCFAGQPPVNETREITVVRTALLGEDMVRVHFTLWGT